MLDHPKLPSDGIKPAYNLAAATTEMMWACALATARVTVTSTARGLAFWTHMLRPPAGPAPWTLLAAPPAAAPQGVPAEGAPSPAAAPAAAEPSAFASYRSASGHAAAQVITNH